MSTETTNLGLTKPDVSERYDLDVWNGNSDLVDAFAGEVNTSLAGKQDALTFDTTPTEDSVNPVTSGGIYAALHALEQRIATLEGGGGNG